ncbi:hypothetical protein SEA_PARADIDDLES_189 [Streptomyces phage Paradiddles]|uniref:Uncharacterized protein n=1 Tax=Streptomyces phage Paradiddles TaxID=2023993 RepID=A0A222YZB8_9CAUD|nr:hypothetical protein FDI37_gp101 [Streptomyces phage Paradiddles]ASR77622.1 hypothetical protein SEA_PARADIDDLES_189 [Streptomyces phage Paradiddles]
MMFLVESQKSQVSASPVKIGSTQTTPKMGEEAFRCSECQYQFPYHADNCSYNMNNK